MCLIMITSIKPGRPAWTATSTSHTMHGLLALQTDDVELLDRRVARRQSRWGGAFVMDGPGGPNDASHAKAWRVLVTRKKGIAS